MSEPIDFELVRRIEVMSEAEAARATTAARAADAIAWGLAQGTVVALDLACKWLDVFGERAGLRADGDAIAAQLERALGQAIRSNRAAAGPPVEDLPLRSDPSAPPAGVDRVVIAAAPDSAKLDRLASSLLQQGVPASALSCFHIASRYPEKRYATSASAWYPASSDDRGEAHRDAAVPTPGVLASLADLEHKKRTLVVILGLPRLSAQTIGAFPAGIVNAHNGLLPHFRGLDSPAWAYAHGAPLGYTLHFIDAELDAGQIVVRKQVAVGSKAELNGGIVADLSELVRAMLAGRSPVRHRFAKGPYFYRMSLRTRRVLDAERRARSPDAEPTSG